MLLFWVLASTALLIVIWKLARALNGETDARQYLPALHHLQSDLDALRRSSETNSEKQQMESKLASAFARMIRTEGDGKAESPLFVLLLALVTGMSSVFVYLEIGNPDAIEGNSSNTRKLCINSRPIIT